MKLSDMKTVDEAVREHNQDAEFRAEWDRTAFARKVATSVVAFRTKKGRGVNLPPDRVQREEHAGGAQFVGELPG
ncbi:hypothetical protein [Micromonospora luteifusca]|uniref:hypothetical protein n=1 Tax=Micromonospora luteifusca TaxID=709860 RepID=UPI00339F129E